MSAEPVRERRAYRAGRRAQGASQTRADILAAAMRLFLARGYGSVTVAEIAKEAATAVPTVYASAGGKAAVLATLIAEARDMSTVEATMAAVRDCTDPREVVHTTARGVRADNERFHDILRVMVTAAAVDEAAAATLVATNQDYRKQLGRFAALLDKLRALAVSQERATDVLWFYFGHQAWHLCVAEHGWSWDETEQWLGTQVISALLSE